MYGYGWGYRLFKKLMEMLVGGVVKSPLEQDFGEEDGSGFAVPTAHYWESVPLDDAGDPLIRMFESVGGLRVENVAKIGIRMREIPVGRKADYQFQVDDGGEKVELQITMSKVSGSMIAFDFRSSNAVIEVIKEAFRGDGGG